MESDTDCHSYDDIVFYASVLVSRELRAGRRWEHDVYEIGDIGKKMEQKEMSKAYAVDFDGTLCENRWPEIGKPNQELIGYLIGRRQQGDKVILWTCRSGELLQNAVEWCQGHGLKFNAVNENLPERIEFFGGDCRKVGADVYIDDRAWNPVTGCLHSCKYCYARSIANRFSGGGEKWTDDELIELNDRIYFDESEKAEAYPYGFKPTLHRYRLNEYEKKGGRNIFVCSMADLFGHWIPDSWIEEVFSSCAKAPQHNYLFLTKNPERFVDLQNNGKLIVADNMWYGASATNEEQLELAAKAFSDLNCQTKTFLSIEPILEDITVSEYWDYYIAAHYVDWVIVGAETGHRKDKVIPERDWIRSITFDCYDESIPVFMKSSLADIWRNPLVQELPKELLR